MKKIINIFILGSLILVTSSMANNQNNKFGSKIFIKCDFDNNGFLNASEYLEMSSKRFNKMDLNKDKQITSKEIKNTKLAKLMPKIAMSWFKRNDIDKNSIVTLNEIQKASTKKFIQIDINNDRQLSMDEWLNVNPSFRK